MPKPKKNRLDLAVLELGLFQSRQEAQAAIMDGAVLVNKEKVTKSGTSVSESDVIELRPGFVKQKYVSRGGLKLEKALENFPISVKDRICLDVGASTGGFTDCLLQNGARQVYAIDVGYGQFDWSLRNDPRVVVKERVNVRYLDPHALYEEGAERADLAVIDCSFISLNLIVPATEKLLAHEGFEIICLVKPQFEAGKDAVKKGVVKDPDIHKEVLDKIAFLAVDLNMPMQACTFSPLKGPKGNIEYLMLLKKSAQQIHVNLHQIVDEAIESLKSAPEEIHEQPSEA